MLVAGGLGEASSSRRSRQGAEHQGDSLHPNTKLTLLTASPPSPPRTGSSTRCTWRRVANSTSVPSYGFLDGAPKGRDEDEGAGSVVFTRPAHRAPR